MAILCINSEIDLKKIIVSNKKIGYKNIEVLRQTTCLVNNPIKVRKAFSKFYRRHYELVSKFKVGLISLLQQELSESEFCGDFAYKLRKIVSRADFSDQIKKGFMRYKRNWI